MTLAERIVVLHRALARRRIAHAFGGAIALAYWTLEPRGTRDIDVNVFAPAEHPERVLRALPPGVEQPPEVAAAIARDGQTRLWWDDVPIDLFFDYVPLHAAAARHRRRVPFAGTQIPVLGPTELAAFKVMFDRTRDWADVEAMLAAGTLDVAELHSTLAELLDADDPRLARIAVAQERAASGAADA